MRDDYLASILGAMTHNDGGAQPLEVVRMSDEPKFQGQTDDLLEMSAELVALYVSRNYLPAEQVTPFFKSIYKELAAGVEIGQLAGERAGDERAVAISPADSVHQDYLVCLEDGQKLTMLKRYLRTQYNMSPEEYRRKWNLPADYPMVAPSQSLKRSRNAKKLGLGHNVGRGSKSAP